MKKIRKIINENLTGKKVLWLFVITNLVYAFMLLVTIPKTMKHANGMKLLDMMPMGYDSDYINTLFETLGDQGRHTNLYNQLPVDMVYPFLFGISYCVLMGYFLKKLNKVDSVFFILCFLPIIAGIADYLENFGILTMLNKYPNLSQTLMGATNGFTVVKSMTTTVYFVALIICLLMLGITSLKNKS